MCNSSRLFLTFAASLASASLASATVVVAWDTWDNTPDYVAGSDVVSQDGVAAGERFGSVFNVLSIKQGAVKQSSRQSTDGTFGPDADFLNWNGDPIAPSTAANSALRVNNGDYFEMVFTNVSGQPLTLGAFYFDYGRSNDSAPQTIALTYLGSVGEPVVLLTDSSTTNTGSVGDYTDFAVNLSAYTIGIGESFTLRLTASDGSSGGNLDNAALTVAIPELSSVAFMALGALGLVARRRLLQP